MTRIEEVQWQEEMQDAAFPGNIGANYSRAVAGYYGGPRAYNVWDVAAWERFRANKKLPIWVAGYGGAKEGADAVTALRALGVHKGAWTAVDMETRVDRTYLEAFGAMLHDAGYRVWVYGSASTVFGNPQLDGYWVADYAGIGPFMYDAGPNVEIRATQYAAGELVDSSTVKPWTLNNTPWWQY